MKALLTRFVSVAAMLAILTASGVAATSPWRIDPQHTAAQFSVRHLAISTVRGQFSNVKGTVQWDDEDITKSTVDISIDVSSVDTREPKRDAHLKSADFFDAAKYPEMTFKSKKIEKAADGKLKVIGDLTIRGTTKEVILDVDGPTTPIKDMQGMQRAALTATTKINRQDYGVKWNATMDNGGVVVGDEISIVIDLEMIKQSK
jgi:polyisoprenoid-binding protein YceI